MDYKSILTILTDEGQLPQLQAAEAMARREDGHLEILCLGFDFTQPGYYFPGGTPYVFQESVDSAIEEAEALKGAVTTRLENSAGLRWCARAAVAQTGGMTNLVGMRARYSDLTVMAQPYGSKASAGAEAVIEAAMFEGDCPVLVVPEAGLPDEGFKRILIAWNQSSEAMSAVRRALPLLRAAETVEIAIIDPGRSGVDRAEPGAGLAQLLTRHGVKADVAVIARTAPTISDEINRRAMEIDAHLIVMGAYGHSRFREAILGGATRNMLEKSRLPVFMAR
ncbi:MAG: universal stress protein [Paracoccus sp. (in: a-proteobacteria)]